VLEEAAGIGHCALLRNSEVIHAGSITAPAAWMARSGVSGHTRGVPLLQRPRHPPPPMTAKLIVAKHATETEKCSTIRAPAKPMAVGDMRF